MTLVFTPLNTRTQTSLPYITDDFLSVSVCIRVSANQGTPRLKKFYHKNEKVYILLKSKKY
jgi:hypothetical protein